MKSKRTLPKGAKVLGKLILSRTNGKNRRRYRNELAKIVRNNQFSHDVRLAAAEICQRCDIAAELARLRKDKARLDWLGTVGLGVEINGTTIGSISRGFIDVQMKKK